MCSFWAGGISSFPFSRAREYRLLRRLQCVPQTLSTGVQSIRQLQNKMKPILTYNNFNFIVSTLNVRVEKSYLEKTEGHTGLEPVTLLA
jgi:hypothetical protein